MMSRSRWLAGAMVALLLPTSSCSGTRQISGASTTTQATVGAAPGRLMVRANELAWSLGEPIAFAREIDAAEVGRFTSSGEVVRSSSGAALPDHVEMAAALELADRGADGILITHYLVEEEQEELGRRTSVRAWGRLLVLDDLGPMDAERADLRRVVETLEQHRPATAAVAVSSRMPLPSLKAAAAPAPARADPRPRGSKVQVRHGLEVGTTVAYKMSIRPKSGLDAIAMRVMAAQLHLMYFSSATAGVGGLGLQVEVGRDKPVQGVFGLEASMAYAIYAPTPAVLLGMQADPKGPFEFELGAAAGLIYGSTFDVRPHLTFGWVW